MNVEQYLEKMKEIQTNLLEFIDDEELNPEKDYETFFKNMFSEFKNNSENLISFVTHIRKFLNLILNIANNHHRSPYFISRLSHIFKIIKPDITSNFSNNEIFDIFEENKLILLLLINENIMDTTMYICNSLKTKYSQFFMPEIFFLYGYNEPPKTDPSFYKKRLIGENDEYICQLIRNDSVEDFITYVNQANYPLNSTIQRSIFETNQFLIGKSPSLIEYSAFFGSINIFKYLYTNEVDLRSSLWIYAIHSNSAEMIYQLESLKVKPLDDSFNDYFVEAVKCHHNNIAQYIQNFLMQNQDMKFYDVIFKFNNYELFPTDAKEIFYNGILYDKLDFVLIILQTNGIDINCYFIENKNIFFNEIFFLFYMMLIYLYVSNGISN